MLQIVTLLTRIMFSQQKLGTEYMSYHFCLDDGAGGVNDGGGGGCCCCCTYW